MRKNTLKYIVLVLLATTVLAVHAKKDQKIEPSYAWTIDEPLGDRTETEIDTSFVNYHLIAVPTSPSIAYATTGNMGAPGEDQIFFNRDSYNDFFFENSLAAWLHSTDSHVFYNTRIPMTLLSHTTGGNKYSNQDRTMVTFSGNAGKRLQIGANLDYIYSKGSYEHQADKNFQWNLGGSYTGDRYELQTFFNHYAFTTKENGGITDDRYITDPAEVQGGDTRVDNKSIPTRLTSSESNMQGTHFFFNNRYKVGFYRYVRDSIKTDSIISKTYVPVTSFIWTLDYRDGRHRFTNKSASEDAAFFKNTYLSAAGTADTTRYMQLTNTVGISMLEGFNKWAKFGFSAYAYHQLYRQTMQCEVEEGTVIADGLDPIPASIPRVSTENRFYAGAKLSKTQGSLLHYTANVELGVAGGVEGDIFADGDIDTQFKMLGDTVTIRGYGAFSAACQSSMLYQFASNHYIWDLDLAKTTRMRVGGELDLPFSGTNINVGYETLKNYTYFGNDNTPTQYGDMLSVFSATLKQDLSFRALHWDNEVTYQTSSNQQVLPLPKIALYSNLYLQFLVAKVLHVQLGVDCNYYTSYYAPRYNPATMTFHTQDEIKCGDFMFMNAYANFRLKKARFFVMYSHANGKIFGGDNYFSSPHYPLNPRCFRLGVSVDFTN